MKTVRTLRTLVLFFALGTVVCNAQKSLEQNEMKTYLIEREIPNAGKLTTEQLQGISQKSCSVIKEMDAGIEWLHSYVTENKVYCVYQAKNETLIREHAEKGGFPVNNISILSSTIGPSTATQNSKN